MGRTTTKREGEKLNELALFAGAGGGILGGHLLGWRTVCAVERDAYAAAEKVRKEAEAQANRPNQNCVFKYCPDEAACRAHGCQMGAPD